METKTNFKPNQKLKETVRVSGAEAVMLSLIEEGVDLMFGYVGGAIMPVYDALYTHQDKINHILVRHEQGAIHAAQGYARVKKKTGVCLATSGPGATNLVTGLADAMLDSTPLVCITGQVAGSYLGTDAFQETDIISITMAVTKWNFQIKKAEDIPETLAKAFHFARTGRPGPVLVDITKDAQFQELDYQYKKIVNVRSYIPYPKLNIDEIKAAADIINEAKNPLLLVGQGVLLSEAQDELKTFIEKSGIPVASTLLGLSAFPSTHPLFMGMLGMHGNYGPNKVTNECDVLIAVGMRFDDRVTGNLNTYAKQAKVIHLELDKAEINKNVKVDVAINADAKQALTELTKYINKKTYPKSIEKFEEYRQVEFEKIINGDLHPESKLPKMGEVINKVSEQTKGEAVVVTDVGQHQMSTARYYQFNKPHSLITSGGLGTMGFGLPAALGAKLGTDRDVVVFIGDGGFQMTIQELGTISQTKAPVKIILLNNGFLGMVRQWQDMFFDKRYSSVELTNPDFITIAKGYGISARRVSSHEELDGAIQQMLEHDEAFLLEVVVEKEENVFPMVPAGGTVSDMMLE